MSAPLDQHRQRLDAIDSQLLELLRERNNIAADVLTTKISAGLPIFVPEREQAKVTAFRRAASERGLDPEWAEDFLRLVMSSSRARQSQAAFPQCPGGPRRILLVGGGGQMGQCYRRAFTSSGHTVTILETDGWNHAPALIGAADAVIVTVPIRLTDEVITRLGPHLAPETVLADFTSHKARPLRAMLDAHPGPVLGLHPMHGPDVANLSKQLVAVCDGRDPQASQWLLDQFRLWGLRLASVDPQQHDRIMDQVQGLRHFVALLHGSFMRASQLQPQDLLALSSPIYRAELMMTGRIFAQNAELYADIVFGNPERRKMLLDFLAHHQKLADLVRHDDKAGFIREFEAIGEFFGDFAAQARVESSYLIHRLADRFV